LWGGCGWQRLGFGVHLDDFCQVGDVGLREIDGEVCLGEDYFEVLSLHRRKEFLQLRPGSIGVLEHGAVIGAQGEVVLSVTPLQLLKEFDFFKVVSAVVELEREHGFADLTDRLTVSCVLFTEVLCGLLFYLFAADGNRAFAFLGESVWGFGGFFAYAFRAAFRVAGFVFWKFTQFLRAVLGQNAFLVSGIEGGKFSGSREGLHVGEPEVLGCGLLLLMFL
jgi:hypothetical protein